MNSTNKDFNILTNCDPLFKKCPISNKKCPGECIYSDVLENVSLGIIIFDIQNKRVEFQNNFAFSLFNYSISKYDYVNLMNILFPDKKELQQLRLSRLTKTLNFGNRILGYTHYKISDQFVLTLLLDITEKERIESIASAINMTDNLGYIFMGLRHEIGNPLNSIKMSISVLKNKIDMFSKDKIIIYIDRVQKEIDRIEYLMTSLKNFNMYENIEIKKININHIINDFISIVHSDLERKNISIVVNSDAEDNFAYVDPRAFQQVLLNIITNSIDALESTENPKIFIYIYSYKKHTILEIIDNGCGIAPENINNIFKPFFTTKKSGTGLGLLIVKKLLSKMNCTIQYKSEVNRGTNVIIHIPQDKWF